MTKVSLTEFQNNVQRYEDQALTEPVTITEDGRDRLVLLSAEEYARLKRRDRRVVVTRELTEEEIELISKAEVPAEYAYLDEELKDWKP